MFSHLEQYYEIKFQKQCYLKNKARKLKKFIPLSQLMLA